MLLCAGVAVEFRKAEVDDVNCSGFRVQISGFGVRLGVESIPVLLEGPMPIRKFSGFMSRWM